MILDTVVEPVTYRKKLVGDVERYMTWLHDPNRQYFPKNRLLSFLQMNLPDSRTSSTINGSTILLKLKSQRC